MAGSENAIVDPPLSVAVSAVFAFANLHSKVRRFRDLVRVSRKIRKLFGPENSCVPLSLVGIYCAGVANCIYRRCPQLPSNKTKSRPMTMALSHVFSLHAYMFIYRL